MECKMRKRKSQAGEKKKETSTARVKTKRAKAPAATATKSNASSKSTSAQPTSSALRSSALRSTPSTPSAPSTTSAPAAASKKWKIVAGVCVVLLLSSTGTVAVLGQTHDLFGLRRNYTTKPNNFTKTIISGKAVSYDFVAGAASLSQFGSHYCSASLISSSWLLTAAHCQPTVGDDVVVGSVDARTKDAAYRRKVAKVVIYDGYNDQTLENDICLVKLDRPVTGVEPMKINKDATNFEHDTNLTAAGWGKTRSGMPQLIRAVQLRTLGTLGWGCANKGAPIPPPSREWWPPSLCDPKRNACKIKLNPRTVCAGGRDSTRGICSGDSGGPLYVERAGSNVLVAVSSFAAVPCGQRNTPDGFLSVLHYHSWITYYAPAMAYEGGGGGEEGGEGDGGGVVKENQNGSELEAPESETPPNPILPDVPKKNPPLAERVPVPDNAGGDDENSFTPQQRDLILGTTLSIFAISAVILVGTSIRLATLPSSKKKD